MKKMIRRAALHALVSLVLVASAAGGAAALPLSADDLKTIAAAIDSGDRSREQTAILRLGRSDPRAKETVKLCTRVLKTSHSALSRFYATMVLAGEPKGGAGLIQALKDPSPDVRGMAAEALGLMKHKPAVKHLKKVVAKDRDDEVTAYAASALVALGAADPKVLSNRLRELVVRKEWPTGLRKREELLRVAGYGDFKDLRGGIVLLTNSLAKVATRPTRSGLVVAAEHGTTEVRLAAAASLGGLAKPGDFDVVKALERLRDDRDPGVRAAAMKALVSIGYTGKRPD